MRAGGHHVSGAPARAGLGAAPEAQARPGVSCRCCCRCHRCISAASVDAVGCLAIQPCHPLKPDPRIDWSLRLLLPGGGPGGNPGEYSLLLVPENPLPVVLPELLPGWCLALQVLSGDAGGPWMRGRRGAAGGRLLPRSNAPARALAGAGAGAGARGGGGAWRQRQRPRRRQHPPQLCHPPGRCRPARTVCGT